MNELTFPFAILSKNNGVMEPKDVTLTDVVAAQDVICRTDCLAPMQERMEALNVMKAAIDRIDPDTYVDFCEYGVRFPQDSLPQFYEKHPALYWYDHSFDRVLEGVKNTEVPAGKVYLWLVYNMGYVVKTPTKCFAIDLHHRRAEELVPYLDFCCITHNHDDHYTERFAMKMNGAGKPVISNFYPNAGYPHTDWEAGYSKEPMRALDFGDVRVTTYESDHNAKLRKFVQPVEIRCKTGEETCVIYSSGDSCFPQQLHTLDPIDFWIVHPYVGLNIADGAQLLEPKMTLVSHLFEFHHRIDQWRWTWRQGYDAANAVWNVGMKAIVPVWGDRIEFSRS